MTVTLKEIVKDKKESVDLKKTKVPLSELKELLKKVGKTRDFTSAISTPGKMNIIGELKRTSPSAGRIRNEFDIDSISRSLAEGGASAVSVLTEEKYFHGDLYNLITVYQAIQLPILRKDFIFDEYQIYEARVFNADAVLLITAILSEEQLKQYIELCKKLDLAALVEVHEEEELKKALNAGAEVIGVNNRNLSDFSVDVNRIFKLRKLIPEDKVIVCESGIKNNQQIHKLRENNINAVLIGETLMRSTDISGKLRELLR